VGVAASSSFCLGDDPTAGAVSDVSDLRTRCNGGSFGTFETDGVGLMPASDLRLMNVENLVGAAGSCLNERKH
jgi:hypothetical protein